MTDPSITHRLTLLSRDLVAMLSRQNPSERVPIERWSEYHGFKKATLTSRQVTELVNKHGFPVKSVQIEIVQLERSMAHELHYHVDTYATVVILGRSNGFHDPEKALVFMKGHWYSACPGMELDIPPEIVHGFTVHDSGILNFLSVQTPPLLREDRDDFITVPCPEIPQFCG